MHVSLFLRCSEQFRGRILLSRGKCQRTTKWLVSSVGKCSHSEREAMGSSPGRVTIFSSPVTFGGSVWVRGYDNEHQKVYVSLFLRCSEQIWARILLSRGGNVKGRPSGPLAQLAECSHGKRQALDLSPGRV